ncbi:MAG: hypothetical protein J6T63_06205 [Bacteroidales bacterium]|nr:hypothetical protein [Bacteroidales bacterium]
MNGEALNEVKRRTSTSSLRGPQCIAAQAGIETMGKKAKSPKMASSLLAFEPSSPETALAIETGEAQET